MQNHKQFFFFLFGGGIAAFINLISRYIFNLFFSYTLSIMLAYGLGMLIAFIIFKFLVFKVRCSTTILKEALWFVIINILGVAQTLLLSLGLAEHVFPWMGFTWHGHDVAHIIGVAAPVVTSYFGHTFLTFGRSGHASRKLG